MCDILALIKKIFCNINIDKFKKYAEFVQSIVTISAFIIGGIWTYNQFVKKREIYAHANVCNVIIHKPIEKKYFCA